MDNFEFLRYITIGQYIPTGSFLHRLDPRTRLLALGVLLAAVTFTTSLPGLAIGLAAALLLLVLSRIPPGYALRGLLPPLPFLLILALLQVLFATATPGTPVYFHWYWVTVTPAGLLSALKLLLRFATLILMLSLGSYTISTSELIHGLESLLSPLEAIGLPVRDFVMAIQVMLRFVPFLAIAAERIAKGQASRGAEWGTGRGGLFARVRQSFPLIVPLFLTGLRRAETLALSMEARGYANPGKHTSMTVLRFTPADGVALVVALALAVGIVAV